MSKTFTHQLFFLLSHPFNVPADIRVGLEFIWRVQLFRQCHLVAGIVNAVVAETTDVDACGELFLRIVLGEVVAAADLAGDEVMEGQGGRAAA
ncbi:hypothetical protein [Thiohalobacter thiocyanaticus]|uniref:hypothetical protein n=1 Tax=Thiohalobacter thiocyanaticus TaxID=585455 RepID=UPI001319E50B|nr:hypothetical protein [Thiohalobacter thiocyanaticus]